MACRLDSDSVAWATRTPKTDSVIVVVRHTARNSLTATGTRLAPKTRPGILVAMAVPTRSARKSTMPEKASFDLSHKERYQKNETRSPNSHRCSRDCVLDGAGHGRYRPGRSCMAAQVVSSIYAHQHPKYCARTKQQWLNLPLRLEGISDVQTLSCADRTQAWNDATTVYPAASKNGENDDGHYIQRRRDDVRALRLDDKRCTGSVRGATEVEPT